MVDGQNIVVDQLVKIIQALQIGRTTGSLIATRGEGASYEVGTIVFVKGKVMQAKAGRREDRDALNWLSTWGKCRYTFVLSITAEGGTEEEGKSIPVPMVPMEGEGRGGGPSLPGNPGPSTGARARQSFSGNLGPSTGARAGQSFSRNLGPSGAGQVEQGRARQGVPATMNQAVPYRSKPLGYALHILEEKSLSRAHRHLFLLVNGERSIGDFMRLLQLNEYEVLALLYDLQDAGMISIPAPLSF
jgi:hypothetical protein